MTEQWWGGLLTLIGIGVAFVCLVAVHLLPTGLDPLRDPVSRYHLTRYRGFIATSTVFTGLTGIAAILVLVGLLGAGAVASSVLLGVFAAARLLIPALRMDAPGSPTTLVGRSHNVLAFLGFGAVTAAAYVAAGALHDRGLTQVSTWSTVFAVVMTVGAAGILVLVLARRGGLFGLFERLIYLGFIAWFVLIGTAGLTV